MITIGIDPSINSTGIAAINNGKLIAYDEIKTNRKLDIPGKLKVIGLAIPKFITHIIPADVPRRCIIEMPEKQTSEKGFNFIEKGDFVKLCAAFGVACLEANRFCDEIFLFTPSAWKGQTPKKITRKRMEKLYGIETLRGLNHDAIDALALASFLDANYPSESIPERKRTETANQFKAEDWGLR